MSKKPEEQVLANFSHNHPDGQDEYIFMKQNGNLVVRVTINGLSHDVPAVVFCHLVLGRKNTTGLNAFASQIQKYAYDL